MSRGPIALFEVNADRVTGAYLDLTTAEKNKPVCLSYLNQANYVLPYQENLDPGRLMDETIKGLGEVAQELTKAKLPRPKHFFCFLASPFHTAQTRIIHWEKKEPFAVTRKLIQNFIRQDQEHLLQTASGQKIIDAWPMQIKLNRYITKKPEHQEAKELEIATLFGLAPTDLLAKFNDALNPFFHQRELIFHSATLAQFELAQELFPDKNSFFLLQIGGEITELSLVQNQVLSETVSYPLGSNFLMRTLGTRLGTNQETALSMLKLYQEGKTNPENQITLEEVLGELRVRWLTAFQELLKALAENHFLPSEALLFGDSRLNPIFQSWLASNFFAKTGLMKKGLTLESMGGKMLAKFCPPETQKLIPDEGLLIDSLFCAKMNFEK